ncbi:PIEZ1 protein, partial [Climacteris rufus]|nr:PIEZ1 protein [Climacteris rufus]
SVPRALMAPVPLQLAYQAWVTNTRTVLRQQEPPETAGAEGAAERSNILQRALNTLRFLWLLCQALVDGLTQWLDACTREHTDMSNVLRLERYVLAQRLATVSPGGHRGTGGGSPRVALTPCPPQGEEMNSDFPDELYVLPPEEPPEELSPPWAADSQNGTTSRQVHRYPPRGLQEQVTNLGSREDLAQSQQFLAVPQQRRRTASELLTSRCGDMGTVGA